MATYGYSAYQKPRKASPLTYAASRSAAPDPFGFSTDAYAMPGTRPFAPPNGVSLIPTAAPKAAQPPLSPSTSPNVSRPAAPAGTSGQGGSSYTAPQPGAAPPPIAAPTVKYDPNTDPALQQVNAYTGMSDAQARAAAAQQQRDALLAYGSPDLARQVLGDQTLAQAASQNPTSTLAGLSRQREQGLGQLINQLNPRNLLYSGERIRQEGLLGQSYQDALAQAASGVNSTLSGIQGSLGQALTANERERAQALADAVARSIAAATNAPPPLDTSGGGTLPAAGSDVGPGGSLIPGVVPSVPPLDTAPPVVPSVAPPGSVLPDVTGPAGSGAGFPGALAPPTILPAGNIIPPGRNVIPAEPTIPDVIPPAVTPDLIAAAAGGGSTPLAPPILPVGNVIPSGQNVIPAEAATPPPLPIPAPAPISVPTPTPDAGLIPALIAAAAGIPPVPQTNVIPSGRNVLPPEPPAPVVPTPLPPAPIMPTPTPAAPVIRPAAVAPPIIPAPQVVPASVPVVPPVPYIPPEPTPAPAAVAPTPTPAPIAIAAGSGTAAGSGATFPPPQAPLSANDLLTAIVLAASKRGSRNVAF